MLAATAISAAGTAGATSYKCVPTGTYSDQMPTSCPGDIHELNVDGSIRRVIKPPRTAEQRRADEEAHRKWQECNAAREAQQRDDHSLVETYANEHEIVAARDALLRTPQGAADRARLEIQEQAKQREKLENERQFYVNHPVPPALARDIEANEEQMQLEKTLLAQAQAQIDQLTERYGIKQRRFHDLAAGTAQTVACPPEPTASE